MTRVEPEPPSPLARESWADNLRCLATIAVVLLHTCSFPVDREPDPQSVEWQFANVLDSACRWSVPAFVMLSGALLLPKLDGTSPAAFYRRRLSRLLAPIAFWTLFYIGWFAFQQGQFDAKKVVVLMLMGIPYYHLWFLYMIAGIYVAAPFLAVLTKNLPPRMTWSLAIGGLLVMWPHAALSAVWNAPGSVFVGWIPFVPYFLLGHLLSRSDRQWDWRALAAGFVLSVGAIAGATSLLIYLGKPYAFNLCYGYFNPLVTASAVAMFLLVRARSTATSPIVRRISESSLGIYLVHPLVLDLLKTAGISATRNPIVVWLPLTFLLAVSLSAVAAGAYRGITSRLSRRP